MLCCQRVALLEVDWTWTLLELEWNGWNGAFVDRMISRKYDSILTTNIEQRNTNFHSFRPMSASKARRRSRRRRNKLRKVQMVLFAHPKSMLAMILHLPRQPILRFGLWSPPMRVNKHRERAPIHREPRYENPEVRGRPAVDFEHPDGVWASWLGVEGPDFEVGE